MLRRHAPTKRKRNMRTIIWRKRRRTSFPQIAFPKNALCLNIDFPVSRNVSSVVLTCASLTSDQLLINPRSVFHSLVVPSLSLCVRLTVQPSSRPPSSSLDVCVRMDGPAVLPCFDPSSRPSTRPPSSTLDVCVHMTVHPSSRASTRPPPVLPSFHPSSLLHS